MKKVLYFDNKYTGTYVEILKVYHDALFVNVIWNYYQEWILPYDMEVVPQKIRPLLRILYK